MTMESSLRQPVFDPQNVAASLVDLREAIPLRALRLDGAQAGETASLRKGHGFDYNGSREYIIGDDVRYLDWKATARDSQHKLQTRIHYQDITPDAWVLTDALAERYRVNPGYFSEQQLALSVVIGLMMAARNTRNPVGLIAGGQGDRIIRHVPRHQQELSVARHLAAVLPPEQPAPRGAKREKPGPSEQPKGYLTNVLRFAGSQCSRSLVAVVSDFREVAYPDDVQHGWKQALQSLAQKGNSLVAVEITNPWDYRLPEQADRFRTSDGVVWIGRDKRSRANRTAYEAAARQQQAAIDETLAAVNAYHIKLSTADPLWLTALRRQLSGRR